MFTPPAQVGAVLATFAPLFTQPSRRCAQALLCGMLLSSDEENLGGWWVSAPVLGSPAGATRESSPGCNPGFPGGRWQNPGRGGQKSRRGRLGPEGMSPAAPGKAAAPAEAAFFPLRPGFWRSLLPTPGCTRGYSPVSPLPGLPKTGAATRHPHRDSSSWLLSKGPARASRSVEEGGKPRRLAHEGKREVRAFPCLVRSFDVVALRSG